MNVPIGKLMIKSNTLLLLYESELEKTTQFAWHILCKDVGVRVLVS